MDARQVEEVVLGALREDLGRGDVTGEALAEPGRVAVGFFLAKQPGVLAGLRVAETAFRLLDASIRLDAAARDGDRLQPGRRFATVRGAARALLAGERVALNFLQRLSGVATATRRAVEQAAGTGARILDTRKTAPLLRAFDKYAVRVGGGHNHRSGLDDGLLIKDNHIVLAGGVTAALRAARAAAPHLLRVEVEVKNLSELEEALAEGAEVILLDNMTTDEVRAAVRRVAGGARLEVSGGVTPETVRAYAETGVDYISLGALTHSVQAVDISFELEEAKISVARP